ncbi:hypothetical protein EDB84DRAFT_55307 [Lactarius hengduanensis]|nr:hypothetical protein EDB84DRAFT_55307 [Lactarius hengduanensis]
MEPPLPQRDIPRFFFFFESIIDTPAPVERLCDVEFTGARTAPGRRGGFEREVFRCAQVCSAFRLAPSCDYPSGPGVLRRPFALHSFIPRGGSSYSITTATSNRVYLITNTGKFLYTTNTDRPWDHENAPKPLGTPLPSRTKSSRPGTTPDKGRTDGGNNYHAKYSSRNQTEVDIGGDIRRNCTKARDKGLLVDPSQTLCESYHDKAAMLLLYGRRPTVAGRWVELFTHTLSGLPSAPSTCWGVTTLLSVLGSGYRREGRGPAHSTGTCSIIVIVPRTLGEVHVSDIENGGRGGKGRVGSTGSMNGQLAVALSSSRTGMGRTLVHRNNRHGHQSQPEPKPTQILLSRPCMRLSGCGLHAPRVQGYRVVLPLVPRCK